MVEILPIPGRLIDGLSHGSSIFRMGALENKFQGWFCRSVALEDTEGFVRPNNLARGDAPSEATCAAQFLCPGQIRFALLQSIFRPLALSHVDDKDNLLVSFRFEKRAADQNRHAAATLPEIFLLEALAAPGRTHLGERLLIGGSPFCGRQLRPPYLTRDKVFTAVAQHVEK